MLERVMEIGDWNNGEGVMWIGGAVMNAVVGDSCMAEGGSSYWSIKL